GDIQWFHVRHEEVAAFAAGAEAHLTGELAVCAGSCGPGNLHLINGLFDCHRSRVPVLAIAAHIPSPEIGSGYFQETHPQTLFQECSHYCELVSAPHQMPRMLEVAIREAVGKRGVSVIVIPGDVALQPAADAPPVKADGLLPRPPVVTPSRQELDRLAALLNGDDRITILCGSGCQGAHDELIALGERLKAPMVHALRGKEHVEWENPYDVGNLLGRRRPVSCGKSFNFFSCVGCATGIRAAQAFSAGETLAGHQRPRAVLPRTSRRSARRIGKCRACTSAKCGRSPCSPIARNSPSRKPWGCSPCRPSVFPMNKCLRCL